ncbi:MAG TPA: hypothetical protein DCX06_11010 [Opitutae bacterium]|nr:hypothetical protein [Opitutae bacterium]
MKSSFYILIGLLLSTGLLFGQLERETRVADSEVLDFSDFPNYNSADDVAVQFFSVTSISEDLFISRSGEYKRIQVTAHSISRAHYYDSGGDFILYRKGLDPEGQVIYTPVSACKVPANTKDIIIAINSTKKGYTLFCIDMSLRAQELGTARFVNLTTGNLLVLLDEERGLVEPGQGVEVEFDMSKTKFFNFKIAVQYEAEARVVFTKRYPFRGKTRRLFIGYLSGSNSASAGPFRVFSSMNAGTERRPVSVDGQ